MAAASERFPIDARRDGSQVARRIVGQLIERLSTWEAWASLSDQFQALAEAAPDIFLAAIERDLSSAAPLLPKLFVNDDGIFTSSPHPNLLWALEALAWHPDYLPRASLALARLSRLDTAVNSRNASRPHNSLRQIYLTWHPCTTAGLDQRLSVLDMLRGREPEVAWQVLLTALPSAGSMATSTAKPRRRDWTPDDDIKVTIEELFRATTEIVRRLGEDVGSSALRWCDLIGILNQIPAADFEVLIDQMSKVDAANMTSRDRAIVHDRLLDLVKEHRQYPDADWTLPEPKLARLAAIGRQFEPGDLVGKVRRLFRESRIHPASEQDWKRAVDARRREQIDGVSRVLGEAGLDAVLAFAEDSDKPLDVGNALGHLPPDEARDLLLLTRTLGTSAPKMREMGIAFLHGRAQSLATDGESWLDGIRESSIWTSWEPEQRATYYTVRLFSMTTWQAVDSEAEDVQRLYWRFRHLHSDISTNDCLYVVRELLRFGLTGKLIKFLGTMSRLRPERLPSDDVASTLEAIASAPGADACEVAEVSSHDVRVLLDLAETAPSVDEARMARLEWFYLPLTRHSRPARALHRALATDPQLYVDLLKLVFKARSSETAPPLEGQDKARGLVAWQLLSEWKTLPGSSDVGMDGARLYAWIEEVRRLAVDADRLTVADLKIGELLAHAPKGSDGLWPHDAVRELIERLQSDDLEQGICVELSNRRTSRMREVSKGIEQDRALASKYRRDATSLRDRSPRVAAILDELARWLILDAERQTNRLSIEEDHWTVRRPILVGAADVNIKEPLHTDIDDSESFDE